MDTLGKTMNKNKNIAIYLIGFAVALFFSGCSSYGKIKVQAGPIEGLTVQDLEKNWQDYDVYYTEQPLALLFDPKGDGRTLSGNIWNNVENIETIQKMIKNIEFDSFFQPRLYWIFDSNDQLYGYLYYPGVSGRSYYATLDAVAKVIDDRSLSIFFVERYQAIREN